MTDTPNHGEGMTTTEERKHMTAVVGEITGEKMCYKCNHYRKIEGGRRKIDSLGRPRWVCKECSKYG